MHRALRVSGALVLVVAVVFALLKWQPSLISRSSSATIKATVQDVLANPVQFATNRITGGVGVSLSTDPASGLPIIVAVLAGSPAEKAKLRVGDLITKVGGLATTNRPLAQIVQSIRGFTGSQVTLSVERAGTTNLECVIQRSSWKTLRGLRYSLSPYE